MPTANSRLKRPKLLLDGSALHRHYERKLSPARKAARREALHAAQVGLGKSTGPSWGAKKRAKKARHQPIPE